MNFEINNQPISIDEITKLLKGNAKLKLGQEAIKAITECRSFLDQKVAESEEPIYGVNTGFGSLCDTEINADELNQLQENLVKSHACGIGEEVPDEVVKLMLLLKVIGLAKGYSGVQLATVNRLIDCYNHDILPVVYQQGSLGASGDLAPLAHLCLPLIGFGEVHHNGQRLTGAAINHIMGWESIQLRSKEGLALLNGTQFMSAYATHCLIRLRHLSKWSDFTAAASIDAYDGYLSPFDADIHAIRPHQGQIQTAENIRKLLKDSEIIKQKKSYVQDPYCLRCVPQVHGASKDTITHALKVVETEINSVTDNPTVFMQGDKVISAGNFHGQPLALVLDYLAIAAAELGNISERRTYKLMGGTRGLPAFLSKNPGLNSGFMIVQYAAASVVSQNKQLAVPASIDSIDSSNGQEDHVSMGANAATKLYRVLDNLEKIVGIEWLSACQALEFRSHKSSTFIEKHKQLFRDTVSFVDEDVVMYPLMEKARAYVAQKEIKAID